MVGHRTFSNSSVVSARVVVKSIAHSNAIGESGAQKVELSLGVRGKDVLFCLVGVLGDKLPAGRVNEPPITFLFGDASEDPELEYKTYVIAVSFII